VTAVSRLLSSGGQSPPSARAARPRRGASGRGTRSGAGVWPPELPRRPEGSTSSTSSSSRRTRRVPPRLARLAGARRRTRGPADDRPDDHAPIGTWPRGPTDAGEIRTGPRMCRGGAAMPARPFKGVDPAPSPVARGFFVATAAIAC
jgi:hypothetical protein